MIQEEYKDERKLLEAKISFLNQRENYLKKKNETSEKFQIEKYLEKRINKSTFSSDQLKNFLKENWNQTNSKTRNWIFY